MMKTWADWLAAGLSFLFHILSDAFKKLPLEPDLFRAIQPKVNAFAGHPAVPILRELWATLNEDICKCNIKQLEVHEETDLDFARYKLEVCDTLATPEEDATQELCRY